MTKKKGFKKNAKSDHVRPALEQKKAQVDKIAHSLKGAHTVAFVDARSTPDRLLQSARKQLRGKATFLMAKNAVIARALDKSGVGKEMASHLGVPTVLVTTTLTPYGLFRHFKTTRAAVAAKPGQIAPFDIVVKEGETDLPPGPALSELKNAGINAQIKAGKIVVAKDSVVAKAGTKISDNVCKALQKLNVKPFTAGLTMVAGLEGGQLYKASVLDIDEVQLVSDLVKSSMDSYNMSINVAYPTEHNRQQILGQAINQARALVTESGAYSVPNPELLLAPALRLEMALGSRVGNTPSS